MNDHHSSGTVKTQFLAGGRQFGGWMFKKGWMFKLLRINDDVFGCVIIFKLIQNKKNLEIMAWFPTN